MGNDTSCVAHCVLYFRPAMTRATATAASASTMTTARIQTTTFKSLRMGGYRSYTQRPHDQVLRGSGSTRFLVRPSGTPLNPVEPCRTVENHVEPQSDDPALARDHLSSPGASPRAGGDRGTQPWTGQGSK